MTAQGRERSLNSAIGDAVDIVCLHLKAMAHERFPLKWKRCHHFQLVQIPQIEIAPSGADDVFEQTFRFRQHFHGKSRILCSPIAAICIGSGETSDFYPDLFQTRYDSD